MRGKEDKGSGEKEVGEREGGWRRNSPPPPPPPLAGGGGISEPLDTTHQCLKKNEIPQRCY